MANALKKVNLHVTAQTERATPSQVKNNAGGYVFKVTPKSRLERFLILGTDGGTYYASERTLTNQNVSFLAGLAASDTKLFVDTVVDVSTNNRAAKNSPAIFALAVALNSAPADQKALVRNAVPLVARTATHLFEFAQYVENLSGWGRAKRSAIANWYESKTPEQLAYQAVKYRQRDGWTHRDLLRLAHPKGLDAEVLAFVLGKPGPVKTRILDPNDLISGFNRAQRATSIDELVATLNDYPKLPWETVPTQFHNDPKLWTTLFENGALGHTALIRNVTRFEKIGLFKDLKFAKSIADALTDADNVKKGRLHPIAFLNAYNMYRQGQTTPAVLAALQDGFYVAFGNVEPSNARTLLALDVSGSMGWTAYGGVSGLKGMSPREASAAMATVTLRTEPYVDVVAFQTSLTRLNVSAKDTFDQVVQKVSNLPFGGTDCSLPMLYAKQHKIDIDHFVVYTDSETWAGHIQPFQALRQYRQATGINAKLTVVGLTATEFTIANAEDGGMLDVVGFDANAPKVMAEFARV